jgi:two-component system response regulator AtoC
MMHDAPPTASRVLLTWSDRGGRFGLRPDDPGPVLRLLRVQAAYDQVIVLTTPSGLDAAETLIHGLRGEAKAARLLSLPVDDPSDHAQLFAALGPVLELLPRRASLDVLLSAGTPQAQTLWVILSLAGLLDPEVGRARLIQVIPPEHSAARGGQVWREVRLDIDGFPQVRALKDEVARLRAERSTATASLLGESAPMHELRRLITRLAPSGLPVLILGETGTGKELVARALHAASPRAEGPFVAESCGALDESTLLSTLFGHERGAFTGAHARHRGLFEQAHGGTLFLDEVGELSPRVQAALLRALQEGAVRRLGAEGLVTVDARVVTATHRDLHAEVAAGRFREDLYYRLRGAILRTPPLRERMVDLEPLVARFLAEAGRPGLPLSPEVWAALRAHPWPGNVRALRAEVQRWAVLVDERVGLDALSEDLGPRRAPPPPPGAPDLRPLADQLAAVEDQAVQAALAATGGNLSAAARLLDIDRNTLKRKLRREGA